LNGDDQIRLMVVDDHAVVRAGICSYVAAVPDVTIVGESENGSQTLQALAELGNSGRLPDVILLDLILPDIDGVEVSKTVTQRYPGVRTVILTSFSGREHVRRALEARASGYVLKDAYPEEIMSAVRAAVRGELYLDAAVTRWLAEPIEGNRTGTSGLTPREREVLVLIASGQSNRQIGTRLGITERTARTHVSNLLAKLGLASRTQAALLAVQEGLAPRSVNSAAIDATSPLRRTRDADAAPGDQ
jgi:DNA-binding NarL/FixJ family response regulator